MWVHVRVFACLSVGEVTLLGVDGAFFTVSEIGELHSANGARISTNGRFCRGVREHMAKKTSASGKTHPGIGHARCDVPILDASTADNPAELPYSLPAAHPSFFSLSHPFLENLLDRLEFR